jgi:hypothetical protein
MEGAEDLDVQALKDSPAYGRGTFREWRRELGRPSSARQSAEMLLLECGAL